MSIFKTMVYKNQINHKNSIDLRYQDVVFHPPNKNSTSSHPRSNISNLNPQQISPILPPIAFGNNPLAPSAMQRQKTFALGTKISDQQFHDNRSNISDHSSASLQKIKKSVSFGETPPDLQKLKSENWQYNDPDGLKNTDDIPENDLHFVKVDARTIINQKMIDKKLQLNQQNLKKKKQEIKDNKSLSSNALNLASVPGAGTNQAGTSADSSLAAHPRKHLSERSVANIKSHLNLAQKRQLEEVSRTNSTSETSSTRPENAQDKETPGTPTTPTLAGLADINDPSVVATTFINRCQKFPAKSMDLAILCKNLSGKIEEFLPAVMRELQKQYNTRFELNEEQFSGFCYFIFDLWTEMIDPETGITGLGMLVDPIIVLLGELIDIPYAEKAFFKTFTKIIPVLPVKNLARSKLLEKLRLKSLTAALLFQKQQKLKIEHKIQAIKNNSKGKNENIFQYSRKNYLRSLEFFAKHVGKSMSIHNKYKNA